MSKIVGFIIFGICLIIALNMDFVLERVFDTEGGTGRQGSYEKRVTSWTLRKTGDGNLSTIHSLPGVEYKIIYNDGGLIIEPITNTKGEIIRIVSESNLVSFDAVPKNK